METFERMPALTASAVDKMRWLLGREWDTGTECKQREEEKY
jgi:hypothetical protein